MTDTVKIVGLVLSAAFTVFALYLGEREFAYAAGSLFAAILTLPPIGRALAKMFYA